MRIESFIRRLAARLTAFRDETCGSWTVEMVVTMPIMIWGLVATYEFFEIHRYQSVRDKATYTIADMFSREEIGNFGGEKRKLGGSRW